MAKKEKPENPPTGREANRERHEDEQDVVRKLPDDVSPGEERGERPETARAIATGGGREDADEPR